MTVSKFGDLEENMDLKRSQKYCIQFCITNCDDLRFLDSRLLNEEKSLKKEERSEWDYVVFNLLLRMILRD